MRTVIAGNMEMDYVTFGGGEKNFVIIPGLSIHSVMGLEDIIAEAYKDFAKDYTVYVFDRAKNFGKGYTIREMAADTAKAMETLGIEKADIFGASQGGMLAMYLAIDSPEMVNKLILGSTLAKPNETFTKTARKWNELAKKKDETALAESFVDNVFSEGTLKVYREALIKMNSGITEEEFARLVILTEACKTFDCYDELAKIKCPTLVIGSRDDRVVTPEGSEQLAEALSCELYMYEDCYGHAVYDEAPDYKQRCLDFLAKD